MREVFKKFIANQITNAKACSVLSVDKDGFTCDVRPLDGGADLLDVLLRADDTSANGQVVYPTPGSTVLVVPIDNNNAAYCVVMFSEVDEVVCQINNTRMVVGESGVTIARGDDGLKACLNDLVDEILKIYAPMNKVAIGKIKLRIAKILNDAE